MKHPLFFILALWVTLAGCSDQTKKQYGSIIEAKVISLKDPTIMHSDSAVLGEITWLFLVDDQWLFYRGNIDDWTIHANSIKGDSILFENVFTRRGRGPGEITEVYARFYKQEPNSLFFGNGHQLFKLKNSTSKNFLHLQQWERISLSPPRFNVDGLMPLQDGNFLLSVFGGDAHPSCLARYNPSDSGSLKYIPFPYHKTAEGLSNGMKTIQYYGLNYNKPSGGKFVYTAQSGLIIFIAEVQNDTLSNIRYLFDEPLISETDNANETRLGLFTVRVTNNYIYILETKNTLGRSNNKETNEGYPLRYGKEIYVFDWEGNPVKRILLDRYIMDFVIDSKDQKLYASTMNISSDDYESYIVRYNIK